VDNTALVGSVRGTLYALTVYFWAVFAGLTFVPNFRAMTAYKRVQVKFVIICELRITTWKYT
jgi:hypothetical protein